MQSEALTTSTRPLLIWAALLAICFATTSTGLVHAAQPTAAAVSVRQPPAASPIDTLVVCPAELREALAPWLAYRASQGHRIALASNEPSAEVLHDTIRQVAAAGGLRAVLLVGGARLGMENDPAVRARSVPVHYPASRVIRRFGGEKAIASDNGYADLDGDGLPDVSVGRLPVETPEELTSLVRRTIDYERSRDFGAWRRRINLVAGVGEFGPLVDQAIEDATRGFLTGGIPAGYQTSMTYANWRSPFCPDPRQFGRTAVARFNEGCLFWVYLGHGQVTAFDQFVTPGHRQPICGADDLRRIDCQSGSPIALLFCCYAGAFDAPQRCLAAELLRQDGGPVAVLAGSRMTMPYGMAALSSELLDGCFKQHCDTLGELVLNAKRRLAGDSAGNPRREALDKLAVLANPSGDQLPAERLDHLQLFNLLGDPWLRIGQPQVLKLNAPREAAAGTIVEVEGQTPVAGRGTLELVVRRDRLTFTPQPRVKFDDTPAALAGFQETYLKANDLRLVTQSFNAPAGKFRIAVRVPADAEGACYVRAFVEGQEGFAIGAAAVHVARETAH
ncbi:MAG: hypothetical protein K8T25_13150 [Planctomycetia bacterium]|nr:hypothetical protein [Planctomycetia bacterium]